MSLIGAGSTRMLRNLRIENSRPSRPTRTPRYSAGPGLLKRTASAMATRRGDRTMRAQMDTMRSNTRFIAHLLPMPVLRRSMQARINALFAPLLDNPQDRRDDILRVVFSHA